MYHHRAYTPEVITSLEPYEIFVFASNNQGIHKSGSAAQALKFGAILGQARGLQGRTYAIVTKDLRIGIRSIPLEEIKNELEVFIDFAKLSNELFPSKFLMTKIGTGLAGYTIKEIANIFHELEFPDNVILPKEFV